MDPFSGFNPWLVIAAALFIGFVLGRVTLSDRPGRNLGQRRPRVTYVPVAELDETAKSEVRDLYEEEGKISATISRINGGGPERGKGGRRRLG